MQYKLGKLPPERRLSTIALSDYMPMASEWPAVKPRGWEMTLPASKLNILGNDLRGNCVIAAMMHFAQNETANTGAPLTPNTQLTLGVYSAITGFDPSQDVVNPDGSITNPTDNGTTWEQALAYWQSTGIPLLDSGGKEVIHKIVGFAALDLSSIAQQRYACDTFGGTLMGINCPQSAMDNTSNWTYVAGSAIEGGHGINRTGQGGTGWHINSWGLSIPGTWEFSLKLADEDYIVVTPLWLDQQGTSPSGLDLNGLIAAMKAV